jgi:hypothetical protein
MDQQKNNQTDEQQNGYRPEGALRQIAGHVSLQKPEVSGQTSENSFRPREPKALYHHEEPSAAAPQSNILRRSVP